MKRTFCFFIIVSIFVVVAAVIRPPPRIVVYQHGKQFDEQPVQDSYRDQRLPLDKMNYRDQYGRRVVYFP